MRRTLCKNAAWVAWSPALILVSASTVRAQSESASLDTSPVAVATEPSDSAALADSATLAESATLAPSPWRADFLARIWLMGVHGDVGARGRSADIDSSFLDVVDESDSLFAVSGRLELGYRRITAFVDAFYADIGVDDASGPAGATDIDVDLEQTIVDFGLMYRLLEREPTGNGAGNPRPVSFDAYAGGRYSGVELTLDPADADSRSRDKSWVDPIVGGKLVVPVSQRWRLELNGDVGGFGAASDFTWSATGVLAYDFHIGKLPASVSAGYRAVGWDYTDDDENEFKYDVIAHGLVFGFALHF